ncbi:hypothetical protein [Tahibacter amnicola]|uniref:Uncharacterized protein n=1 Tax=Tahibacter amnicola TaxID=2976241 RepID=A0ABY6B9N9_9GAMM|nr:hypothetical protein [Tahibacter amnicola]UXI66771.1 hypothetical protein N4264_18730 [Tahibacter amnicola]
MFRDDGTATWVIGTPFEIGFSASPHGDGQIAVDLNGFTQGPLQGKTLYCLAQVTPETTLRLDCEPGSTADARPTDYDPKQTQEFRRP